MQSTSRNRVEILNWRKYGDDEAYCRVGVFPAGDTHTVCEEVDEQMGITAENRQRWRGLGDPELERIAEGKLWYVNDHILLQEGDIIKHKGRKFRLRIEEIKEGTSLQSGSG